MANQLGMSQTVMRLINKRSDQDRLILWGGMFITTVMGLEFYVLSRFLERILMEHIQTKNSSYFKLQIESICSVKILSRARNILKKTF